jgi:hypothetical protein
MSPFRSRGRQGEKNRLKVDAADEKRDGSGIKKLPQVMIPGERENRYVLDNAGELQKSCVRGWAR